MRKLKDEDLWDMRTVLAKIIYRYLKEFRKYVVDRPINLENDEEWKKILDKMIFSFKCYSLDNLTIDNDETQEGLDLFAEYFSNLRI